MSSFKVVSVMNCILAMEIHRPGRKVTMRSFNEFNLQLGTKNR